MLKKRTFLILAAVVALAALGFFFVNKPEADAPGTSGGTQKSFDKKRYSTSDPASIWVVVNKKRPIKDGYAPADLSVPKVPSRSSGEEAQVSKKLIPSLEKMVADAKKAGINLKLASGYRSYGLQANVYDGYVRTMGQAEADRISAKPGTSEHQTGLSFDVEPVSGQCEVEVCFADLAEGKWVAANAHKYGFIIRYPKGKESVTGYSYEPWHLRYVGTDLAAELKKQKIQTLEEFFGL